MTKAWCFIYLCHLYDFFKQTTLDFTNYYLNLTEVNRSNKPVWQKEYSAKVM